MPENLTSSEKPKKPEAVEVTRDEMSSTDIEDLRFLRNHLSQFRKDWSQVDDDGILDDFFWEEAHSFVIREDLGEEPNQKQRIVATGQLDLVPSDGIGIVEHIVAHPDVRGRGLGKAIMEKLIDEARNRDLSKLVLTSNPSREAAHGLYKSLGFVIVGEKQKYDGAGNPTHKTSLFELDLSTESSPE